MISPRKSTTMKYLSVCSGIEAATVAWHPLGWQPVAFGEIEKFPCKVLAHHYPDTPNWGDMTKFKEWPDADVNVFVGGTPCQSFSVAGLRKGLDDPRGNLMLTYLAIAARYRPRWLVWENVPGVLSSNGGLDFASLLRGMGELGYGFAYRILDAQYFGVAQRRRRVFVVGYLGNWRPAAAVLFERHSLCGYPAPSRKARQVTPTLTKEGTGVSRTGHNEDGWYVETPLNSVGSLCARTGLSHSMGDFIPGAPSYTLTKGHSHAVAQAIGIFQDSEYWVAQYDTAGTLRAGRIPEHQMAIQAMAVRRLTPVECERLQGFPDNYTDIKPKGKATPDGPRYKALGNSMAVPVMAWIGKRIQEVDAICQTQKQ